MPGVFSSCPLQLREPPALLQGDLLEVVLVTQVLVMLSLTQIGLGSPGGPHSSLLKPQFPYRLKLGGRLYKPASLKPRSEPSPRLP